MLRHQEVASLPKARQPQLSLRPEGSQLALGEVLGASLVQNPTLSKIPLKSWEAAQRWGKPRPCTCGQGVRVPRTHWTQTQGKAVWPARGSRPEGNGARRTEKPLGSNRATRECGTARGRQSAGPGLGPAAGTASRTRFAALPPRSTPEAVVTCGDLVTPPSFPFIVSSQGSSPSQPVPKPALPPRRAVPAPTHAETRRNSCPRIVSSWLELKNGTASVSERAPYREKTNSNCCCLHAF